MSYILNALRKSEKERLEQQGEMLENRIQQPQKPVSSRLSLGLMLLVVINVLFLLFYSWQLSQEDKGAKLMPDMQTVSKVKLENKAQISLPVINQPMQLKTQVSIAEQIENNKTKQKTAYSENKVSKQLIKQIQQPDPQVIIQEASVIEPKAILVAPSLEKQEQRIPYLSALEYEFRRTVPVININVYVYAENQQDRFIMIAMKKYLVGAEIDSGMVLKEIRMNGLVVEYNNRVFKIRRR